MPSIFSRTIASLRSTAHCYNRLCGAVEEMSSSSGSTLSISRGYAHSYPGIVPFERCDHTHRSTGYTHSLREVVVPCLLGVSNREVTKITVHAHRRRAIYYGNVAGDAEAQPVPGEERVLTPGREMTLNVCLVMGMLRRFPLEIGISSSPFFFLNP